MPNPGVLTERRAKPRGFSVSGGLLKLLGILFTGVGVFSVAALQHKVLHTDEVSAQALYDMMQIGSPTMRIATWAVVCSAISSLALPIFALSLLEGFGHTRSFRSYLLRMAALALVCEAPFDMAMRGRLFDASVQNPLMGYCICLVMLYFFQRFDTGKKWSWMVKLCIVAGACLWVFLLKCQSGIFFVLLVAVFWIFRDIPVMAMVTGTIVTILQFPAPLGLFLVHAYRGEKGRFPKWIFYAAYPAILLLFGIPRMLAM